MKVECFTKVQPQPKCASAALLFLRLVAGTAFIIHGWGKIQHPFGWMPAGTPVPGFFQFLAALSEFGGGIAWLLGIFTPLFSLGIAFTMMVAVYMHAIVRGDPFVSSGGGLSFEPALGYLAIALVILMMGPGKFSLGAKIFGEKK